MTHISPSQIPATGEELARAIKSYRSDSPVTAGMEMELFLLNRDRSLPTPQTHDKFYKSVRQSLGDRISVEPGAHMIELKSGVHRDAVLLTKDLLGVLGQVTEHAAAHGLQVQPSSDLPGFPVGQLAANLVSRTDPETGKVRRVREIVDACKTHGWTNISDWGASTTSIHYTHSVADAGQMHRYAKVHAAMMPVYYAALENRTRENGVHDGLRLRRMMGARGLVAPYVFTAEDGNDFADRYVAAVQSNQILTMLDRGGHDAALPRPMTFRELEPEARNVGNLMHAASASWNVCRIKPIIDQRAARSGNLGLSDLLLEVRDLDVSREAVPAIAGWLQTLTRSESALSEAEIRLETLGVPVISNPRAAGLRTVAALAAVEISPRTLDTHFGDPRRNLTVRDAVEQVILPMMASDQSSASALGLWTTVAASPTAVFKHNAGAPHDSQRTALRTQAGVRRPSVELRTP